VRFRSGMFVGVDDALGRRDDVALRIHAVVKLESPDDAVGGDGSSLDVLEVAFEDSAGVSIALGEEPDGVCVTIESGAAGKPMLFHDSPDAVPSKKIFLNGLAVGMVADGAETLVPLETGSRGIGVLAGRLGKFS